MKAAVINVHDIRLLPLDSSVSASLILCESHTEDAESRQASKFVPIPSGYSKEVSPQGDLISC